MYMFVEDSLGPLPEGTAVCDPGNERATPRALGVLEGPARDISILTSPSKK
jgi:hypothetical protein